MPDHNTCRIGIIYLDKSIDSINVSTYGYPTHLIPILLKHYQTETKVAALLDLGDLIELSDFPAPPPGGAHSAKKPCPFVTVAKHRDAGEPFTSTRKRHYSSIEAFKENAYIAMYHYLFDTTTQKWYRLSANQHLILIPNQTESPKETWIQKQLCCNKRADKQVLGFIYDFLHHQDSANAMRPDFPSELLRSQFRAGYCYYFAVMLQAAFERGTICWCAPYGHMVWVDENNVAYDIEGINTSDCTYYIPISYLGDTLLDFLHIPGKTYNTTEQEIADIIVRYEEEQKGTSI